MRKPSKASKVRTKASNPFETFEGLEERKEALRDAGISWRETTQERREKHGSSLRIPARTHTITDDDGNTWGGILGYEHHLHYTTEENALERFLKHQETGFQGCTPTAIKMMHEAAHRAGII